jgi:hypothetical protein
MSQPHNPWDLAELCSQQNLRYQKFVRPVPVIVIDFFRNFLQKVGFVVHIVPVVDYQLFFVKETLFFNGGPILGLKFATG